MKLQHAEQLTPRMHVYATPDGRQFLVFRGEVGELWDAAPRGDEKRGEPRFGHSLVIGATSRDDCVRRLEKALGEQGGGTG